MNAIRRFGFALISAIFVAVVPASSQDHVTISNCSGQSKIPVVFQVDCTHSKDSAARQLCGQFAENEACKVSPAYRKITNINLEDRCPTMRYNLFEKDNWPFSNSGDAGGLAGKCEVSLLSDYSVKVKSEVGPYDLHELLHEYQAVIGPFINEHPMFDPAQAEAARLIGDPVGTAAYMNRIRHAIEQAKMLLPSTSQPADKECGFAESFIENSLYLQDSRNVYAFYRKLGPVPASKTRQEVAARENRMLYTVSYGKAKDFLLSHGCWPF